MVDPFFVLSYGQVRPGRTAEGFEASIRDERNRIPGCRILCPIESGIQIEKKQYILIFHIIFIILIM